MSADTNAAHGEHDHDHGHHGHEAETPHVSMREYVTGFILAVILTAIPFWLVMARPLDAQLTGIIIVGFAVVQIIVHMIYFLHMTPKAEGGWSVTSLLFTVIVIVIMLAGSLWVMHHLNSNMMPQHQEAEASF